MMQITDDQAKRLLKLLDEAEKPLYLFSDRQDHIIASEWLDDDAAALAYARKLQCPEVFILKAIGIADQINEDFWLYAEVE